MALTIAGGEPAHRLAYGKFPHCYRFVSCFFDMAVELATWPIEGKAPMSRASQ